MAPPFGVHARVVVRDAQLPQHRQTLRRERLVQLDYIDRLLKRF